MNKQILLLIGIIALFTIGISFGLYVENDGLTNDNVTDSDNSTIANASTSSAVNKNFTKKN